MSDPVYVVKVSTWHRIPKAQMDPIDNQREVAEWIAEEYLGPCGFTADWDTVYAKVEVRDSENHLSNYTLVPTHWRVLGNDGDR